MCCPLQAILDILGNRYWQGRMGCMYCHSIEPFLFHQYKVFLQVYTFHNSVAAVQLNAIKLGAPPGEAPMPPENPPGKAVLTTEFASRFVE